MYGVGPSNMVTLSRVKFKERQSHWALIRNPDVRRHLGGNAGPRESAPRSATLSSAREADRFRCHS
jgi:hypothetical protein